MDQKLHLPSLNNDKQFRCNHCDYKTNYKQSLERHVTIHSNEKPLKCPKCDYRGKNRHSLMRHLRTHKKDEQCQCEVCKSGKKHDHQNLPPQSTDHIPQTGVQSTPEIQRLNENAPKSTSHKEKVFTTDFINVNDVKSEKAPIDENSSHIAFTETDDALSTSDLSTSTKVR